MINHELLRDQEMSNAAYVFDAIRTPRGKGKESGALHEVKPVHLAAGLLREMQRRHNLDTSRVDGVVLGCVSPVCEQGGDIAKTAAQVAGWVRVLPARSSTAFVLPASRP